MIPDTMNKPETRIIPENTPPKLLAQHLKPYEFLLAGIAGKKVLEVGSGDGYGTFFLAQSAGEATGIDYQDEVVTAARAKYRRSNLRFLCMDACRLDFSDRSFDAVCSFQVIEHIPEEMIPRYLSEIKRVLKDGGEFYLSTLNLAHAMKSPKTYKKNAAHCKEFTLHELQKALSAVFGSLQTYGLHITARHRFYERLKKSGVCGILPRGINPVARFYKTVTTADFLVTPRDPGRASDFICVCGK